MVDYLFGVFIGGLLGFALILVLDTMQRDAADHTCVEECVLDCRPVEETDR